MRFFGLFLAVFIVFFSGEAFSGVQKIAVGNNKYASIVIDADSGKVLYSRKADRRVHPASLTKMMTLVLTFDALNQGRLRMGDRIRFSSRAVNVVPSKLGVPLGHTITVRDAIRALVTKSANDVAVALAEHIAGSERKFARQMTSKARSIGMSRTVFKNASGLHDPQQVTTARDMAKLARYIIKRYPQYYRYFSVREFRYRGKRYKNHNKLLGKYRGMDGFKTGYVSASGFNLVASAKRENGRLIGVVFGGKTAKERDDHMVYILDKSFARLPKVKHTDVRVASYRLPPLPGHKPAEIVAGKRVDKNTSVGNSYASLSSLGASSGIKIKVDTSGVQLASAGMSEGDYDSLLSKRIETGLIAIAVHKNRKKEAGKTKVAVNSTSLEKKGSHGKFDAPYKGKKNIHSASMVSGAVKKKIWAAQIGAFSSRAVADKILREASMKFPKGLSSDVRPVIAPLKTGGSFLYRGRFINLSKAEASLACHYFKECIVVVHNTN